MRGIGTAYLVVGAGATAMAFVHALLTETDARVVTVNHRHRPGGLWLDAYRSSGCIAGPRLPALDTSQRGRRNTARGSSPGGAHGLSSDGHGRDVRL
jgi:cation diffusion facilitator CzcD-associated flavoprotein CzcO